MSRWATVLCVLVTACGSSDSTSEIVSGSAVLEGVSYDSVNVASFVDPQRLENGTFVGTLQLSPVAGGAVQTLDQDVATPTFARGTTLYYLAGTTQVVEGTPPRPRSYGTLKAWVPTQSSPVTLGSIVGAFSVSQDGSAVAFIDRTAASSSATGAIKVWSTSFCTTTCTAPITVADGVASGATTLANDGKHVLVDVPKILATPPSIVLVTLPAATMQTVSSASATNARSSMLSPDGATAAWIEGTNDIVSIATASPTTPSTITVSTTDSATPMVQSAVMVDPSTFVAKLKVGSADPVLHLVTASAVTPLAVTAPVRLSVVQETPADAAASNRYLFYATAEDAVTGAQDLWLLDLMNPTTPAVQLAATTSGNPGFSDDGTMIRFFDNLDLDTGRGDLYLAPLPAGTKTQVATDLRQGNFEPGSTTLTYLGGLDANDVGSLQRFPPEASPRIIPGVANFGQSRTAPVLYYTQDLGMTTDGVYKTDPL